MGAALPQLPPTVIVRSFTVVPAQVGTTVKEPQPPYYDIGVTQLNRDLTPFWYLAQIRNCAQLRNSYVIPSVAEESGMPAVDSISRFLDSSATLGMT